MRPVTYGDLDHCAQALLAAPPGGRAARMAAIIAAAETADRYRKRTGRLWRGQGDGSLTAAARAMGARPGPARLDAAYCAALAVAAEALAGRGGAICT